MTARRWDFIPLPDQYPSITAQPVPTEVLGAWDEATAYSTGDVVSYWAGPYFTLFRATADSTGEAPVIVVEGDGVFSDLWELLAGESIQTPCIVYQAGVSDPRPTGDMVVFKTTSGGGTATGGTVTFSVEYSGAGTFTLVLPYDFDTVDIRAAYDAIFGEPGVAETVLIIEENGPGDATIQATGAFAAYRVLGTTVTNDSITWDGDHGTPTVYVTVPGFAGVGGVPGLFLGAEGSVWGSLNLAWYRLIAANELTEFVTALSTAATIGDINTAATDLLSNL